MHLQKNDVAEEFTCSICQELMLCAMTIECSHSFCSPCISNWLERKKQCPVCRENISKPAVRSRNLDNIITKLVEKFTSKDKEEWEQRVKAQSKQTAEEMDCKKLVDMISDAKSKHMKFLNVTEMWTPEERRVFLNGVSRYMGRARGIYCETTGLTPTFVQHASVLNLRLASTNLELASATILATLLPGELQKRLNQFMEGSSLGIKYL